MNKVPDKIVKLFKAIEEPACFDSGRGDAFRCGEIVLKRIEMKEEAEWIAKLFSEFAEQSNFRIPKPLKSSSGNWVEENWVAWTYVEGEISPKGKFDEQFKVCDDFHKSLKLIEKPDFIGKRSDPWSVADRVTWQEIEVSYDGEFGKLIDEVIKLLEPIEVKDQLVHGDLLGNILFKEGEKPTVIDYSFYWRPTEFAKAVMIADAIAWGDADTSVLKHLHDDSNYRQLMLRGILRRMVEQAEQIIQFGKDKNEAMISVNRYYNIVKDVESV